MEEEGKTVPFTKQELQEMVATHEAEEEEMEEEIEESTEQDQNQDQEEAIE